MIIMVASGTLGDIVPCVALGRGLRDAGAYVRVVTHAPFAPLVLAHGLEWADLGPNPSEVLNADPAALTLEGGLLVAVRASLRYVRQARALYARMLAAAWAACRDADAIVVALPTLWGADIAEALGVPLVVAPLQPITPTGAWPSALLPNTHSLGRRANWLSHRLLGLAVWLPWRPVFDTWRGAWLGLAPARADHLTRLLAARAPFVYGFSPWLLTRPSDWPAHHVIAGRWPLPDPDFEPAEGLVRFLAAGPPPVYLGFGSMGARRPAEDAALALEAARSTGRRLVLLGGREARSLASERADVFVVESVPHAWLLPQIAAALHHGGAGTTHAVLRAGAPSAAIPAAADQFFWGARAAALGAGPPPVPRHALDAVRLAELIDEAAEQPRYRRRAAAVGALLSAEEGVARAVELVRGVCGW
jgi:sterol 3beta-glucosyltransferase